MTDFATIEKIKALLEELLARMEVEAKVSPEESINRGLVFNISSPESFLLIGKQGANLRALQIVAQVMATKMLGHDAFAPFVIDVDEYRRKREWHIKESLRMAVEKVHATGRPVYMEPMPSYERRMVHAIIQDKHLEIASTSEGEDPDRKVLISLKRLS